MKATQNSGEEEATSPLLPSALPPSVAAARDKAEYCPFPTFSRSPGLPQCRFPFTPISSDRSPNPLLSSSPPPPPPRDHETGMSAVLEPPKPTLHQEVQLLIRDDVYDVMPEFIFSLESSSPILSYHGTVNQSLKQAIMKLRFIELCPKVSSQIMATRFPIYVASIRFGVPK